MLGKRKCCDNNKTENDSAQASKKCKISSVSSESDGEMPLRWAFESSVEEDEVEKDDNAVKCDTDKEHTSDTENVGNSIIEKEGLSESIDEEQDTKPASKRGRKKKIQADDKEKSEDDSIIVDIDDSIVIENGDVKDVATLRRFIKSNDNLVNFSYISKIPPKCLEQPCILGIDEAGRGPVLGPMVYGLTFCPESFEDDLKTIKCADSKTLSENERNRLFNSLMQHPDDIGWTVEFISPNFISSNMLAREKITLNEIAANSTIELLKTVIATGAQVKKVFVDTLGPPEKYEKRLTETFKSKIKFFVRKKADSLYPIVSAASICAKVSRDQSISVWRFEPNVEITTRNFGSGYPADPNTKKFLESHMDPVFGYPGLVRFSWSTCENMLKELAVAVTWPDEAPAKVKGKKAAPKKVAKNSKITSFFVKKTDDFQAPNYYTLYDLHIVESF